MAVLFTSGMQKRMWRHTHAAIFMCHLGVGGCPQVYSSPSLLTELLTVHWVRSSIQTVHHFVYFLWLTPLSWELSPLVQLRGQVAPVTSSYWRAGVTSAVIITSPILVQASYSRFKVACRKNKFNQNATKTIMSPSTANLIHKFCCHFSVMGQAAENWLYMPRNSQVCHLNSDT